MGFRIEDISYTITEFCPGPCRYCSMWKLPDRQAEELNTREIDSIFSSQYLDLKKIHLTGGEPHMSDTYLRVVDSVHTFHPDVIIDSPITGWFPDRHEEIARYVLRKSPLIRLDISLDGDEATHSKIRLHKDGFHKSLETIERLKKIPGVVLRFQFTIYRENLHLIEWVYNFAKQLGIGLYLGYGRFNPERYRNKTDNLTQNALSRESFVFSKDELQEIDRQLRTIGYHSGRYASKYLLQKAVFDGKNIEFNCYMGSRNIDIDPYGNLYPCLLWLPYLKIGNIREAGGFSSALETPQAHEVLAKISQKECQPDCLYTCANKCELIDPPVKAVGMIDYHGGKYGFIFSDLDVIPIRPWWYEDYQKRGII
ncbi:radical SAM/SPASM domain-containing protein [Chrysiogenes arsenatis]|uniref:radical SAM/SPASM domain-containing protein n=1 Tax=Chrysiogenes arsenatis TaxID=309797 RepID=UPI000A02E718|nr:radical SAM/SPASM domain-containing protein [Chrysiogenes arsenatis]